MNFPNAIKSHSKWPSAPHQPATCHTGSWRHSHCPAWCYCENIMWPTDWPLTDHWLTDHILETDCSHVLSPRANRRGHLLTAITPMGVEFSIKSMMTWPPWRFKIGQFYWLSTNPWHMSLFLLQRAKESNLVTFQTEWVCFFLFFLLFPLSVDLKCRALKEYSKDKIPNLRETPATKYNIFIVRYLCVCVLIQWRHWRFPPSGDQRVSRHNLQPRDQEQKS